MDDAVEVVLTNTPYAVIGQFTGLRIQGTTDSNGILRHDDLPDDYFAVQATGSVELTQVYYTERSDELGDEPWILRMRSN